MEVVVLGSGSPLPDPDRAGPSTLVRTGAGDLLFDCGRGVLMRAAAARSGAGAFVALFLTHLHSDHLTDLNDIVTMRWATSFAPSPLRLFGPTGTGRVVQAVGEMLEADIGYRLSHHADLGWRPVTEVTEIGGPTVLELNGIRVTAAFTDHAPVRPTLGFRIDDGGRSVVIAGDTVPCSGLDGLCADADVLVHTAVRRDLIEGIGLPRLTDVLDYHSSVEDAAETAERNRVGTLLLTHLVPAPEPGTDDEWAGLATARFGGRVIVANDLTTVTIDG